MSKKKTLGWPGLELRTSRMQNQCSATELWSSILVLQKFLEINYYIIDCNNFYIKSSLKILIKTWLQIFWKIFIFLNSLVKFQPFFHRGLFIPCRGPAHFQNFARISLVFVLISASVVWTTKIGQLSQKFEVLISWIIQI